MAAAVVKSFMFDAGASGMFGLRSATTAPVSTSTTCRLTSELRATEPFINELMRSDSVVPVAASAGRAGAALRERDFLRRLAASATGVSRTRTSTIATNRVSRPVINIWESFLNVGFAALSAMLRALRLRKRDAKPQPIDNAGRHAAYSL